MGSRGPVRGDRELGGEVTDGGVDPHPGVDGPTSAQDGPDDVILVRHAEIAMERAQPREVGVGHVLDGRRDANTDSALHESGDRLRDFLKVVPSSLGVVVHGVGSVKRHLYLDRARGERGHPLRFVTRGPDSVRQYVHTRLQS